MPQAIQPSGKQLLGPLLSFLNMYFLFIYLTELGPSFNRKIH